MQVPPNNHEMLGDSIAWGGCTIIYLLGQQLHFELFDFSYQVLNIAEVDSAVTGQSNKSPHNAQVQSSFNLFNLTKFLFFLLLSKLGSLIANLSFVD